MEDGIEARIIQGVLSLYWGLNDQDHYLHMVLTLNPNPQSHPDHVGSCVMQSSLDQRGRGR